MNLMMYIGNDLIESIPLELGRISKPGYLGSFKRALKVKHNDLILQHGAKPEFLVAEPIRETNSRGINQENKLSF